MARRALSTLGGRADSVGASFGDLPDGDRRGQREGERGQPDHADHVQEADRRAGRHAASDGDRHRDGRLRVRGRVGGPRDDRGVRLVGDARAAHRRPPRAAISRSVPCRYSIAIPANTTVLAMSAPAATRRGPVRHDPGRGQRPDRRVGHGERRHRERRCAAALSVRISTSQAEGEQRRCGCRRRRGRWRSYGAGRGSPGDRRLRRPADRPRPSCRSSRPDHPVDLASPCGDDGVTLR